jgi:hypothetical protein
MKAKPSPMQRLNSLNPKRESHNVHQKIFDDKLIEINQWVNTHGHNPDEADTFIRKYFDHLNDNTWKSMYDILLNITESKLLPSDNQNELSNLVSQLLQIKKNMKRT